MNRKLKFVQYGVGKMSHYSIPFLLSKGAELVGAVDSNPDLVGKDVSAVIGGEPLGVTITAPEDADAMFQATKPDVSLVFTVTRMAAIEEHLATAARNGVNAITIAEEAVFPWNSSPAVTARLDQLAKANGVTITGSGYPDFYWGVMVDAVAGTIGKLDKIEGISSYDVDHYGIALAEGHGCGLTVDEFNTKFAKFNDMTGTEQREAIYAGEMTPSYMWPQNGWIAARLGLTVVDQRQDVIPTTHTEDVESSTLGRVVRAGDALGMKGQVTTTTAEGITIVTAAVGSLYAPGAEFEFDKNEWTFHGEPTTSFTVARPYTPSLTCANAMNRIPALIDAPAGYVTSNLLRNNTYISGGIADYVQSWK